MSMLTVVWARSSRLTDSQASSKPSASHVYGVGGFLMAGYQMNRLAGAK